VSNRQEEGESRKQSPKYGIEALANLCQEVPGLFPCVKPPSVFVLVSLLV